MEFHKGGRREKSEETIRFESSREIRTDRVAGPSEGSWVVGVRSCRRKRGESAARGAASRRPRPPLSLARARAADYTALPQTLRRRRDATRRDASRHTGCKLREAEAGGVVAASGKGAPGDAAPTTASTTRDRPVANEDLREKPQREEGERRKARGEDQTIPLP